MIAVLTERALPDLLSLWRECFPEDRDEDYARDFLSLACRRGWARGYIEDHTLLASLCLLPLTGRDGRRGSYLYALCTHPCARGRGIASALTAQALDGGDFTVLIPATDSLRRFYRERGFSASVLTVAALTEARGAALSPSLSLPEELEDLVLRSLPRQNKPQEGEKVYEIRYTERSRSVIMKEAGMAAGLPSGLVLPPLPL